MLIIGVFSEDTTSFQPFAFPSLQVPMRFFHDVNAFSKGVPHRSKFCRGILVSTTQFSSGADFHAPLKKWGVEQSN